VLVAHVAGINREEAGYQCFVPPERVPGGTCDDHGRRCRDKSRRHQSIWLHVRGRHRLHD